MKLLLNLDGSRALAGDCEKVQIKFRIMVRAKSGARLWNVAVYRTRGRGDTGGDVTFVICADLVLSKICAMGHMESEAEDEILDWGTIHLDALYLTGTGSACAQF